MCAERQLHALAVQAKLMGWPLHAGAAPPGLGAPLVWCLRVAMLLRMFTTSPGLVAGVPPRTSCRLRHGYHSVPTITDRAIDRACHCGNRTAAADPLAGWAVGAQALHDVRRPRGLKVQKEDGPPSRHSNMQEVQARAGRPSPQHCAAPRSQTRTAHARRLRRPQRPTTMSRRCMAPRIRPRSRMRRQRSVRRRLRTPAILAALLAWMQSRVLSCSCGSPCMHTPTSGAAAVAAMARCRYAA